VKQTGVFSHHIRPLVITITTVMAYIFFAKMMMMVMVMVMVMMIMIIYISDMLSSLYYLCKCPLFRSTMKLAIL